VAPVVLRSALDRGEWLAPRSCRITPWKELLISAGQRLGRGPEAVCEGKILPTVRHDTH
jgi:hypothetical protein